MIIHILVEGSHNKEHHLLAEVAQSREMYDFFCIIKCLLKMFICNKDLN